MESLASWERKGRHEGKVEMLAIQLEKRFRTLSAGTTVRLDKLTSEQLNELARALFGFTSLADLETWLARY